MNSLQVPILGCHDWVQVLEQGQMCNTWLQNIGLVVFVTDVSIQSTYKGFSNILTILIPGWNAAMTMLPDWESPSKSTPILCLPTHFMYTLQIIRCILLTSATVLHFPWPYIPYSWPLFVVMSIWYPLLKHWPPLRNQNVMCGLQVAKIRHHRCSANPDADSWSLSLGPETKC